MQNQELQKFIQEQITQGVNKEEIKKALLDVGWQEGDIDANLQASEAVSLSPLGGISDQGNAETGGAEGGFSEEHQELTKENKKKPNLKLIIIIAIIIVAISVAGAGAWYYFSGEEAIDNAILHSKREVEEDILNLIEKVSHNVKSFAFDGSLQMEVKKPWGEEIVFENNFAGSIILPVTIEITENTSQVKKETDNIFFDNPDPILKDPETENDQEETIFIDGKSFKKSISSEEWKGDMGKIDIDLQRSDPWMIPYFKNELRYIGKDNIGSRYEIISKSNEGLLIIKSMIPIEQLGINHGKDNLVSLGVTDANGDGPRFNITGNIWVDVENRIIKEDIIFRSFQRKDGENNGNGKIHLVINYSDYNKDFQIAAPIEDEQLNSEISELEEALESLRSMSSEELMRGNLAEEDEYIDENVDTDVLKLGSFIYMQYVENGELPSSEDLSEFTSLGYLYAYAEDRKTLDYHVGFRLYDKNSDLLKNDSDFDSISAGYINGFSGADPVLDFSSEELKEADLEVKQRAKDAIKKSDLANFRLAVEMYYDSHGYYPSGFNDVKDYLDSDVFQRAGDNNYLYAVSNGKKKYHLGAVLDSDGSDQISGDSDFNSLETGFENGFNGADPIYDIYSGSL